MSYTRSVAILAQADLALPSGVCRCRVRPTAKDMYVPALTGDSADMVFTISLEAAMQRARGKRGGERVNVRPRGRSRPRRQQQEAEPPATSGRATQAAGELPADW